MIIFGIILSLAWIWIYIEVENAPIHSRDRIIHKEYFTILGIKICKNFRKPKK